jgi:hypothetical protein
MMEKAYPARLFLCQICAGANANPAGMRGAARTKEVTTSRRI